jgi:hypothetical protein
MEIAEVHAAKFTSVPSSSTFLSSLHALSSHHLVSTTAVSNSGDEEFILPVVARILLLKFSFRFGQYDNSSAFHHQSNYYII